VIQLTPHMRILAAVEPADFRRGIDGLARACREALESDPFLGTVFLFRNRRATAIKILVYDGQGFWLCHKRLSRGRFRFWPSAESGRRQALEIHQVQLLLSGGDPAASASVPEPWRRIPVAG
jgi:transposase